MAEKLKEERSFTNMNNMRKWLHFARQKAEVMVKLIKEFNNSQYGCIKNVQKYILMFLSVSCYIARMTDYFNQIKVKGGRGVLNSLMAKDVDIGFIAGIHVKAVKAGDLVNLASAEAGRLGMSPNAPTLRELGIPYDFGATFVVFAPKGTDKAAQDGHLVCDLCGFGKVVAEHIARLRLRDAK